MEEVLEFRWRGFSSELIRDPFIQEIDQGFDEVHKHVRTPYFTVQINDIELEDEPEWLTLSMAQFEEDV